MKNPALEKIYGSIFRQDTSDPAAKYQDLPFPKTKRLCFWQNWNNTGGTGAALRHFEALGKMFPLAVKLGTITPSGADVYSYAEDEDCMVTDPYLEDHLRHWGIEMKQMKQTEKTMTEMQVELNMQFEFNRITEASSMLVPVTGPCYVGLKNLGNSCYMNAVLQVSNRLLLFLNWNSGSLDGPFCKRTLSRRYRIDFHDIAFRSQRRFLYTNDETRSGIDLRQNRI